MAGAVSMFFSYYLSRRSEAESLKIDMARERMEIETEPEEERSEMVALLKREGYAEPEVQVIMERLSKDKDLWLREMLRLELKIDSGAAESSNYTGAAAAGVSFLLLALLALSPYVLAVDRIGALGVSVAVSLAALFALGSRAFVPHNFRPRAGLVSAAIGAFAAILLHSLGLLLSTA